MNHGVYTVNGIVSILIIISIKIYTKILSYDFTQINFIIDSGLNRIKIEAVCKVSGKTGVEMEAMCAVSVAALTVYDMCKSVDRGMSISEITLEAKSGGASGVWVKEKHD